ncbi:MAG: MFS transporter, partial [Micromonosporaceae bacterium]
LNAAVFNSARIVGPAAAGLLIAWLDTGPVILLNALTYVGPTIAMLLISPALLNRAETPPSDTRISDGLKYVKRRSDLLLPLALVLVVGGLGFNFPVTLALLSKTEFHQGAASFGLLSSALAIGALAGAFASSGRRGRPSVYAVIVGALAFGVFELTVGFAMNYLMAAVLLVAAGFAMIYFAQAANQRLQLATESAYRGRVMSLYVLVFMGSKPLCAPLVGWISEQFGARAGLWLGGGAAVVAAALVLLVRSRRRNVRFELHARPRPHLLLVEPQRRTVRFPAFKHQDAGPGSGSDTAAVPGPAGAPGRVAAADPVAATGGGRPVVAAATAAPTKLAS